MTTIEAPELISCHLAILSYCSDVYLQSDISTDMSFLCAYIWYGE